MSTVSLGMIAASGSYPASLDLETRDLQHLHWHGDSVDGPELAGHQVVGDGVFVDDVLPGLDRHADRGDAGGAGVALIDRLRGVIAAGGGTRGLLGHDFRF